MKCPYCAEEIQDAACACRYCGRDLNLILSLMRENEQLREEMSALRDENRKIAVSTDSPPSEESEASSALPPPTHPSSQRERDTLTLRQRVWAVVLPAIAVLVAHVLDTELWWEKASAEEREANTHNILGLTSWHFAWLDLLMLSCLLAGFWVATRQYGRHLKTYVFLGTITSLVAVLGAQIYTNVSYVFLTTGTKLFDVANILTLGQFARVVWLWVDTGNVASMLDRLLYDGFTTAARFVFGAGFAPLNLFDLMIILTALFVSGGLFGDLAERMRFPQEATSGLAEQIASRVTKDPKSHRRLGNFIRAFVPILLAAAPFWAPLWSEFIKYALASITNVFAG